MAHTVIMPKAGQTMEEGTIVSWLKKEGDTVEKGDPIMVIQTDKADLEVESTASGILKAVLVAEGESVAVLTPVAVIAGPDEEVELDGLLGEERAAPPPGEETAVKARVDQARVTGTEDNNRIFVSPYARTLAREHGITLATLTGTGPDGRIIKRDVEAALAQGGGTTPAPAAARIPTPASAAGELEVIELTGMRKAIAGALQLSKQQAPHFYATAEVDMTCATAFRDHRKEAGSTVSINVLVLRAAVLALHAFRRVNCRVEGNSVTYYPQVNLGVAVGLDDGLVVPVVLDAGRLGLEELGAEARRIATLARAGNPVGMGQGTFTVTNLGMFGVESFCAIINPPEAAILAVGVVKDTVVVNADQTFGVRRIMKLTLSADHRVVDGVLAARFLNAVKEHLEKPESLSR